MNWDKYKKYFKPEEFFSPDEKCESMQESFMDLLYQARELAGVPFKISSGFRTRFQNTMVGGVAGSSHMKGLAADIHIDNSNNRYIILKALIDTGFTRIGVGETFIHCDNDKNKRQGVVWPY